MLVSQRLKLRNKLLGGWSIARQESYKCNMKQGIGAAVGVSEGSAARESFLPNCGFAPKPAYARGDAPIAHQRGANVLAVGKCRFGIARWIEQRPSLVEMLHGDSQRPGDRGPGPHHAVPHQPRNDFLLGIRHLEKCGGELLASGESPPTRLYAHRPYRGWKIRDTCPVFRHSAMARSKQPWFLAPHNPWWQ
jgi:hypothetical protein